MIRGVHTMFYSSQPQDLREFIRDKLGLKATDVGEGWLIFQVPEADMGVHPVDELKRRGVRFTGEISDAGYGLAIKFVMPGDVLVELYQPHYTKEF